jgi:hypothetical protein
LDGEYTRNENSEWNKPKRFRGMREISIVYEASYLACLKLKNRIIRSATFEGLGNLDGSPSRELTDLYIRLAKGGVGAIITGLIGVQPNGKAFLNQCMLDKDSLLEGYKTLTSKLKEYDVPLIAQLAHAGASTSVEITGEQPVGPSKIKSPLFLNKQCRELNETEIDDLINNFVQAIVRAKEAGFDGVQLHAAHAYLFIFLDDRQLADLVVTEPIKNGDIAVPGSSSTEEAKIIARVLNSGKVLPYSLKVVEIKEMQQ